MAGRDRPDQGERIWRGAIDPTRASTTMPISAAVATRTFLGAPRIPPVALVIRFLPFAIADPLLAVSSARRTVESGAESALSRGGSAHVTSAEGCKSRAWDASHGALRGSEWS